MARLEVTRPDGDQEYVKVSHRKPVSIGSHSVSDIVVEDNDVAALACRIAWNGDHYEAVAAADDDIIVNGKATRRKSLKDGDQLSVGSLSIKLERGSEKRFRRRASETFDQDAEFEQGEPDEAPRKVKTPTREADDATDDLDGGDGFAEIDEREYDELSAPEIVDRATKSRIRDKLNARSQRPGQQDATRSPLIFGLAGGVVVLIVATVALTLFIRGQSIEQQFQAAAASVEASRYSEASQKLNRFIASHPVHPLSDRAERLLAVTEVDQRIRGAAPDWNAGYRRLNEVVSQFRDDEDFSALYGNIAERSGLIALGAGADAGKKRDRDLIVLSEQAEAMLAKYSPDAIPPATLLERISDARDQSRERLIQLDVLDEFMGRMEAAGKETRFLDVLEFGRQLAEADPSLAAEPSVVRLVESARTSLRERVQRIPVDQLMTTAIQQQAKDQRWGITPIAIIDRAVGEAEPNGMPVFAWTAETFFAVDAASGDPIWWRSWPESFRPVEISIPRRGVIGYDRFQHSMVIADRVDGNDVRIVALPSRDLRPLRPTVSGGVAFVPLGDRVLRVDLDVGAVTAAVDIGQPALARPTVVRTKNGTEALLVLGSRETAYLVDAKSMDLIEMFVIGHPFGAIVTEPITAAEFVIVNVNRMARDNCRMLMFSLDDTDSSQPRLEIVDEETINGLVLDVPVLRGRDLFVASSAETVAVYTVSDEEGGKLTAGPAFTAGRRDDSRVATYLIADADREFWMAGRRLRRLRATPEAIRPIGDSLRIGSPVNSPTLIGSDVYPMSRRGPGTTSTLSRVNIDDFRERWQLHLESRVIATLTSSIADTLCVVTDRGDVIVTPLQASTSEATPVVTSATTRLTEAPSHVTLVGDRLAAVVGNELTWLDTRGRAEQRVSIGSQATLPIIPWQDCVVVPVRGKLKVLQQDGREALSEFWLNQGADVSLGWQSVLVIDESHLVTLDTSGAIRRLAVVEGESPYFAETQSVTVRGATSVALSGDRSSMYVSDGKRISELDTRSLAVVNESVAQFMKVETLQTLNKTTLVVGESNDQQFSVQKLPDGQRVRLPSLPIGAITSNEDGFVVTLHDRVLLLDANLNEAAEPLSVPAKPAGSAIRHGEKIILPLANGFLATRQLRGAPTIDAE